MLQLEEGRSSFILLMLMLLCIAWSMQMAAWVEGLYVVEWTALGGLIVGVLLTRRRWPRFFRHLLSLVIGVPLIFWVMVRLVGSNLGWRDDLSILAYHFDSWLRIVVAGESSTDSTVFLLLMAVLGWWLGYTSAWLVFGTHKVWQALALTGAAMLVVVFGSPAEIAPFFVLYVFCGLLLAIRVYVYRQERSWQGARAHYDQDIQFYFLRDGSLLLLVVLAAVWLLPLLTSSSFLSDLWAQVEGPWHAMGDQWNRLFSGIRGYRQDYENVPFAGYLALGGPIELSSNVVMWVTTDQGRYWRGAIYERYDGSGWEPRDELSAVISPDMDLPRDGEYELRRSILQTIVPNSSGVGQIFGLGQPVGLDLPVDIQYSFAYHDQGDERDPFSAPAIVSLIKSRIPLARDRPYGIVSSVSAADVDSLRRAGDDYPAWATERYLQLPPGLPQRVKDLAEEIATPYDNDYDRATALQDYLRRTIAYNQDIEPPPPDRDGVDYLLFDSREGYCNYYASAMVVMARAVGIPSRLAVGYAGGDFDSELRQYAVRERNTHAWVEVYFPRYGWVEFEPTASEEPISRPVRRAERGPERGGPDPASELERDLGRLEEVEQPGEEAVVRPSSQRPSLELVLLIGTGAVLAAAAIASWLVRFRRLKGLSEVEKAYGRMCSYSRFIGARGESYQTPSEYASVVARQIPAGARHVDAIASLYVRERFGPYATGLVEERKAEEAWRKLRPLLGREFLRRIPRLVRSVLRWRP